MEQANYGTFMWWHTIQPWKWNTTTSNVIDKYKYYDEKQESDTTEDILEIAYEWYVRSQYDTFHWASIDWERVRLRFGDAGNIIFSLWVIIGMFSLCENSWSCSYWFVHFYLYVLYFSKWVWWDLHATYCTKEAPSIKEF